MNLILVKNNRLFLLIFLIFNLFFQTHIFANNIVLVSNISPNTFAIGSINMSPACFGQTNGSISVGAYGGTLPYWYSINNGPFLSINTFTNLAPAVYTITVKDATGLTTTRNIEVTQNPDIIISAEDFQVVSTCPGYSDGSISISASGGFSILQYSINGGQTYSVVPNFTNLPKGTYNVVVKDGNSCEKIGSQIEITEPPAIQIINQTKTDIQGCFGDNNGVITIEAIGGTSPLQYSISAGQAFQANPVFNGLPFGTYHIAVSDAHNCPVTYGNNYTINQPDLLVLDNILFSDVTTCFGGNDGTAAFQYYGGTPGIQFSVNGGLTYSSNFNVQNLPAGNYYGIIKDANGCTDTLPNPHFTINQPAEVQITGFTTQEPNCFGENNGQVTIQTANGSGTMFHSVNGIDFFVNNTISNLVAGINYTISVKDSKGCTATGATFSINQPSQVVIDTTIVANVTPCFGNTNGAILITAHGGTPGLEFSINDGANFFNSPIFNNLNAGIYTIKVRDAHNCIVAKPYFQLTQPEQLSIINQSSHDVFGCKGTANGAINITAIGGTQPLNYSVDNGTTFTQNNGIFNSLFIGNYQVLVKDNNGCTTQGSSFVINEPSEFIPLITETQNISCYGLSDGLINLSATGGVFPYQFSINGGTSYSTATRYENLPAGNYQVMIKDLYNCIVTGNLINITQPDTLKINSIDVTDIQNCFGDNSGILQINTTGGFQNVVYSVNGGLFFVDNSGLFTNMPAGNYSVIAKDEHGCLFTWQGSATVNAPPELIMTQAITNQTSCFGDTDGSITINYQGGTGTPLFSIDNGVNFSANNVFTNLSAGVYPVVLKDEKGCETFAYETFVYQPNALEVLSTEPVDEVCRGTADGQLTAYTFGGSPPLNYSLDNITFQTANTFYNLLPGKYKVFLKDDKGCTAAGDSVIIGSPENTAIFSSDIQQGCSPLPVHFTRLSNGINLGWKFGDGRIGVGETPFHNFINTTNQPISFTTQLFGMTQNGCLDTASQLITVIPQPKLDISFSTDTLYFPENQLLIQNNSVLGLTSYFWDFGDGSTSTTENPISHNYLSCGNYSILMHASEGSCSDSVAQEIVVLPKLPIAKLAVTDTSGCTPFLANFSENSENVLSYSWNLGDGTESTEQNFDHLYEDPGEYRVILTNTGQCNTTDKDTIIILVNPSPIVDFYVQPTTILPPKQIAHFYNLSEENSTYLWDFGDGFTSQEQEPLHYYTDTIGYQTVSLYVTSPNGCVDSMIIPQAVNVLQYSFYGLPNAFTPNEDGLNDVFKPYAFRSIGQWEMKIYNMWGTNIFVSKNVEKGWDGKYRGDFVSDGSYYWEISGRYATGEPFSAYGNVTLIRKIRK